MAASGRYRALEQAGLLHPAPEAVLGEPFRSHPRFFASFDKVQVKYEMLRAHVVDGESATAAAETHGYSRASFYLVQAAFERSGMVGLLDERPGRRGRPLAVARLQKRQHLRRELHRRTVEKALGGRG